MAYIKGVRKQIDKEGKALENLLKKTEPEINELLQTEKGNKLFYLDHKKNGLDYMVDYAEGKGYYKYYDNKIDSLNTGLNVGLFYKDEGSCKYYSDDATRAICQNERKHAFNDLRGIIKEQQAKTGIKTEKRIFHDNIKTELENAQIEADRAEKSAKEASQNPMLNEKYLYNAFKTAGLEKINRYSVHQLDSTEDDVDKMFSGLHSALYVDSHCGNNAKCEEIRTHVNKELSNMIKAEQKRAGITDRKRRNIRRKKEAENRAYWESSKKKNDDQFQEFCKKVDFTNQ